MENKINLHEGIFNGKGMKIAIVSSRFNDFIVNSLASGCVDALCRHGVAGGDISHYKVPGAFETPIVVQRLANSKKYDAVIALGAIIRGATPHFDYVASESAKGLANIALKTDVPVINGIITTENIEQAIERGGTKAGNKGAEAATVAIEMVSLLKGIK